MHLVTEQLDPELVQLLFEVYLKEEGRFHIHKVDEYTIYILLYTYYWDRHVKRHGNGDSNFTTEFFRDGLPHYYDFLDEVIFILDTFHLGYELHWPEGKRVMNPAKGGFSCVM